MEDSIFGPKPARHINLDSSDSDVVDTNDITLSIIRTSDVAEKYFVINGIETI
jgi:hypothetical protein